MEPKIIKLDQMMLVGLSFYGDPFAESSGWTDENEIGRLWDRFLAYMAAHGDDIQHIREENVAYEVHVEGTETAAKGFQEVFVGVEVTQLTEVPVNLLVKILPSATCAVFTLRGEEIAADWAMIVGEWLDGSDTYESAATYGFQCYDERFKGVDNLAESELDIYVPLKRVNDVPTDGDR